MSTSPAATPSSPWAPPTPIDPGSAGASAERQAAKYQARSERHLPPTAKATRSNSWAALQAGNYAKGAEGERHVLEWQIQAVRAALTPIGFAEAPVTGVLCFTGATWGFFARPLRFDGALVTWPEKLVAQIADGPPTDPASINLVAQQLSSKLPAIR